MKLADPRNRGSHPYGLPLVKSGLYVSCAYPCTKSLALGELSRNSSAELRSKIGIGKGVNFKN